MICLFAQTILGAQEKNQAIENNEVELLIQKLFDSMREGDSAKVASEFSHCGVDAFHLIKNGIE